MTIQEFNFLLAIAEYGWTKAEYHWTYLLLFDPEGNDVAKHRLRSSITLGRTRRAIEKAAKSKSVGNNRTGVPLSNDIRTQDSAKSTPASQTSRARR